MPTPAELRAIRAALRRGDVSRLDRVAAAREELIAALFLASMETAAGGVDLKALERAIEGLDLAALAEAVEQGRLRDFGGELPIPDRELAAAARILARGQLPTFNAGARVGGRALEDQISASRLSSVDLLKAGPRWLRRERRELAVYLINQSKETALEVVNAAVQKGALNATAAARAVKDGIGLSRVNALRLAEMAQDWAAQGLSSSEVASRVSEVRDKLLNERARLFGSESAYKTAQQGQLEAWREALKSGVLAPETKRFWVTRQDDWVCPVCFPLNGQGRRLEKKFKSPYANEAGRGTLTAAGSKVKGPYRFGENEFDSPGPPPYGPHNKCRCAVVLIAVAA